jgi:serine/threonine protein kinase
MDAATRWQLVQDVFFQVVDLPAPRRAEAARLVCRDETVVAEALELAVLDDQPRTGSILSQGIADAVGRLIDAPARLPPDLGAYHFLDVVGEGGMGTVFRAERTDTKGVVAVKVLRDALLSPARRYRFQKEQQLLAQLHHASIAQIYDAGTFADGTPFFAMELVDGGVPITRYCRDHALSMDDRLRLFREACAAVQYAHSQAVIHRDLKPSNILVTREGHVKLLDFGVSKRIGVDPHNDETRDGLRLMTPAFAAPEQLRSGKTAVDTDVYSLGVVLYELLASRPPFDLEDRTPGEIMDIVLTQEVRRPSVAAAAGAAAVSRSRWADLDVLALKAMHREPARRYLTVEALIRDVDHYFKGEPLEGRPDDVRYRLGKFVARHRRALAGTALALGAVATIVVFYTVRLKSARDAAVAEVARTQRVERFTRGLFDAGEKTVAPNKDLRVLTLVDRGLKEARAFDKDPSVQSDFYATLGGLYERLGNLPQAESLLRKALDERVALYGSNGRLVASSQVDLALLRDAQDQLVDAERLARAGLETAKRLRPPSPDDVAAATEVLGRILEDTGKFKEALPVLEQAVRLYETASPESSDLADALGELSNTQYYLGEYEACRTICERALVLHRKIHGDAHPTVSGDLFNLGAVQFERGDYAAAERFYRQGLDITKAWFEPGNPQVASDTTMLARVLIKRGHAGEAEEMLNEAIATHDRVHGGAPDPAVASALNELGIIARERKDYDAAEKAFRRMLAIYRKVYPGDHSREGIALANIASVAMERGDFRAAESGFKEALAVYAKTLKPDHNYVGIARMKLGHALLGERRYAEARAESLAAYEILKKQVSASEDFLQKAREDLATEADALGQPAEARRFRDELAVNKHGT